ncbi:tRNA (adenosine(37)-N6)-threonylcarbamoyltransferase complex ATPase subunit type 1 TsaE [Emticicia aquatilis]|nr:tRNA (adenosine(37)-N6)-threonylcarbamoyltransferase complex ATPase subunit type 1 TsaE [Emticicia aquatilis]
MIYKIADLPTIAQQVIEAAKERKIWIFEAEMGAGKTTLIKAICNALGVFGHIQSPTFSIVNEYITSAGETIYHFDFYRLKNETEALDFGVEEYFDSGNICLLEWAEKVESLLPENCFKINISLADDLGRNIEFS